MILMIFLLLAGHFIADVVLQPKWLSRDKRHEDLQIRWAALGLHGSIHGFAVLVVTYSPVLAFVELVAHMAIDRGKARGLLSKEVDQLLHVGCKVGYAFWLFS